MRDGMSRRELLRRGVVTGSGLLVAGASGVLARPKSPNERLSIGVIGVDGRGGANLEACAKTENIVALCDVDEERLAKAATRFPQARTFTDYRKMLAMKGIDAVTVSTPDHHHAFASINAMQRGIHVYCEKPLTHSIWEARQMAKVAARKKVVTQMGNQGHSNDGTRRVVELVQAGIIGDVKDVHCWTDRPIWPQGIERPPFESPVPSTLNWDLWVGPAPMRPYNAAYHPFNWRGWWDFGTGALGDMACHVMDTAFWALELGAPVSVEAEGEPRMPESAPKWMIIHYQFPERGNLPPVKLTWYDGGKKPPAELLDGEAMPDNGTLMVGDRGRILLPDPYGSTFILLPKERFARYSPPVRSIPNSIGHHEEWIMACKEGHPGANSPGSHFEYAAALTETVLLGNVAFRANEKITWDSERMKARNSRHAEELIHRDYRKGWEL